MPTSLRSPDRTGAGFVSVVLLVVAVMALVLAVALPVHQLAQPGGSVSVTPANLSADRSLDVAGLPEGVAVVDATAEAQLTASQLPAGLRLLTELPTVLGAVAIAVGAWLLGRVLSTIHRGRPFDRRNPGRLAGLAAAVLLGGLAVPMTEGIATTAVLDHLDLLGPGSPFVALGMTLSFVPIGVALALAAAAEAFRRGRALEDELEGTV